jgi:ABC-type multidrug transport system permease subunit
MVPHRWHPFVQLVLARIREFTREPEVLFWVYGFPLLLAIGLGIAFAGREPERPAVDVQDGAGAAQLLRTLLDDGFKDAEIHSEAECKARLVKGKTALYVVPAVPVLMPPLPLFGASTVGLMGSPVGEVPYLAASAIIAGRALELEYVYDRTRAEGVLARYWVEATLARGRAGTGTEPNELRIDEPGSRYIDFLLPGLIGMNLMGGGLFGVGFVLVDMRVRKLFKRLMATPMRHGDFLLALLSSRLLFLLPEMVALLVLGRFAFGVPINGSLATLMLAILLGAAAFSGLGLLLGCRTEKTEAMSGYINATMLPMYLLSGIFFTSKRFPNVMQPLIQALPLTQLNDALREIMLEGAGLDVVGWRLAILAAWAGISFTLALRYFRWR